MEEPTVEQLQQTITDLTSEITKLNADVIVRDAAIEGLEKQIEALKATDTAQNVDALKARIAELENELDAFRTRPGTEV